jgi:glycosyltransferase involved in cell wall biosynthesis
MVIKQMSENKCIGILCPVYNEEENIEIFLLEYQEISRKLPGNFKVEYLFVDNCSTDDTEKILTQLALDNENIAYIRYSRNFGVMKSIFTGLLMSPSSWDALAVFDCDLQDPPELLLSYVEKMSLGYDLIFGKRTKRSESMVQGFFRNCFRFVEKRFQKLPRHVESGAWFFTKKVVSEIKTRPDFQEYLPAMIDNLGFKKASVEYERRARERGTSKFNFFSYFAYALDGLLVGSVTPLRIPFWSGVFLAFISVSVAAYFIVLKLFSNIEYQEGIVAIIVLVLFFNALNFLFLGLIGEFIGRIMNQGRTKRPAIVDYSIGFVEIDGVGKSQSGL